MINKIDEIITSLRDDAILTGLLKGKYIYWQRPSSSPVSYITIREITNSESESADDEEYSDDIEIQADIFTKGQHDPYCKTITKENEVYGLHASGLSR